MKLVICGDSHVVKLKAALNEKPESFSGQFPGEVKIGKLFSCPRILSPFFTEEGEHIWFTRKEIGASFRALAGAQDFDTETIYLLSMFFTNTILIRSSHWSTHLPSRVARPGRRAVSDAVMEAIVLEHFAHGIAFAEALSRRGVKVMALESPPPRKDDPALHRYLRPDDALEIDRLARLAMGRALKKLGIPVVAISDSAADPEDGFLAARYHATTHGDFHHANSALGAMLLSDALKAAANFARTFTIASGCSSRPLLQGID